MFAKVLSGSLTGLDANIVAVEADLANGLPGLQVVGLPDISVRESKDRIRAAITNAGFKYPAKRITINLSPANTRKEGTHFDLPIAIGILSAYGQINLTNFKQYAFLGELSLDGRIKGIKGALPLVMGLRDRGIKHIVLPSANIDEASVIGHINLYPVKHLKEIVEGLAQDGFCNPYIKTSENVSRNTMPQEDFSEVCGQENIKRALQIAAAASHNVLMIGPPGSGKTMMARRIPGILPKLTYEEMLEVTKIFSVAGELDSKKPVIESRQFRAPHHSISPIALVGGGRQPKPGEVSLAHFGVLFFDELPEFSRHVLELLRQPMEDERITIARANSVVTFPAKMMFVAGMNPCPCGYFGDPTHECTCSMSQVHHYMNKISGPLLDRIDLHLELLPVRFRELTQDTPMRTSAQMREEVEAARLIQIDRYKTERISYNSQLTTGLLKKYCRLDRETTELLSEAFEKLSLSARAYAKIVKVARTIADMGQEESILINHVAEAIQYRNLDKKYRGL
jgi:magnesium chelatase family protein